MACELVLVNSCISTSVDKDRTRLGLYLSLKHGDIGMIVIEKVFVDLERLPRFVVELPGRIFIYNIFWRDEPTRFFIVAFLHMDGALDLRHIYCESSPVASIEPSRFIRAVAKRILVKEVVSQGALFVQEALVVGGISQLCVRLHRSICHELVVDDLNLVNSFD